MGGWSPLIRRTLIALHAFLAVGAIGAGQAFARDPSGEALGMATEYLEGSPFPDYRVPGLFLALVIGTANLVSAAALWRRHSRGPLLSFATGVLLVVWVAIQTAIIGYRHWSQFIWWTMFPSVAILAAMLIQCQHRESATERRPGTGQLRLCVRTHEPLYGKRIAALSLRRRPRGAPR